VVTVGGLLRFRVPRMLCARPRERETQSSAHTCMPRRGIRSRPPPLKHLRSRTPRIFPSAVTNSNPGWHHVALDLKEFAFCLIQRHQPLWSKRAIWRQSSEPIEPAAVTNTDQRSRPHRRVVQFTGCARAVVPTDCTWAVKTFLEQFVDTGKRLTWSARRGSSPVSRASVGCWLTTSQ
jgi:hypothetical protein